IPRTSYNEKQISDWLVKFGNDRGLETIQDEELNVIIKKPGTKGYEDKEAVILQGHMDMVGEKSSDSDHDFEKDPLKLRVVDGHLFATDTTLGGDNGIAVAMGLAVLDSDDLEHPPIELLVTTAEEVGMDGAAAVDPKLMDGTRLLNIDSEEEGIFFVSCAGGRVLKITFEPEFKEVKEQGYELSIFGLLGGHSGMEIIKQRGNAVQLLGRALKEIGDVTLSEISGGAKHNAIPRDAKAVFTSKSIDQDKVKALVMETFAHEYPEDPMECEVKEVEVSRLMDEKTSAAIINYLVTMPDGVQTMMKSMENMVESSLNSGVLEMDGDKVVITHAVRSSSPSRKEELATRVTTLAQILGAKAEQFSDYPEWEYDPDSKLKDTSLEVYKKVTGKEPEVKAIHAGLECGLLKQKMPNVDMISFGPDMADVHTPNEHLSIESVERTWDFMVELLKAL
ncbi:MAG: aminoacyl-histidine dipeptidase, partial [Clostridium sp.]|nr:aminoacyl-histidine dipeptidase [Clostridium sp.]